jgi:predicted N-acyltransferase
MPDGEDGQIVEVCRSLAEVDRDDWDARAGPDNPFLCHDFLSALEESASVRPETGWLPQHLLLRGPDRRLVAAMPMYLKGHSQGEYVFDYSWAHAYENAGGSYYPKLLSAVPFTPVPGPRLLTRGAPDPEAATDALIGAMVQLTERHGVSSLHVNFVDAAQADRLESVGFLVRHGHQYHWSNDGYATFDDFLEALASRKRKAIRKERRAVREAGLTTRALTGDAITPALWDAFYAFYTDTYDRKWGAPYLTRRFFDLLHERMRDRVVLMLAFDDAERPIAGALNLVGTDAIFGRNWGCLADYKFLHFELCYYMSIDWAIEHGLSRVEAGTQGEHKIQRGYLPVTTYSAHLLPDPNFRDAVARFLEKERLHEENLRRAMAEAGPYKKE